MPSARYLVESHEQYVEEVVNDYEAKVTMEQDTRETLRHDKDELVDEFDGRKELMEEDARLEIQARSLFCPRVAGHIVVNQLQQQGQNAAGGGRLCRLTA